MFKVKRVKFFPHKCLLPDVKLNEDVNKLTRRKLFFATKISLDFLRDVCLGNVSTTHRVSFVLLSFYGESLVISAL